MGIRQAIADIRTMNALFTTAEQEAAGLGDDVPGAEHLVLAVLALPDDSARRVFATFDLSANDVRAAILRTHTQALHTVGIDAAGPTGPTGPTEASAPSGPYRSTGSLQEVFQRAVALSKEGPGPTHTLRAAHVVWAASESEFGTVSRTLGQLGVNRVDLQEAARKAIAVADSD